jgi:hypothetical protein
MSLGVSGVKKAEAGSNYAYLTCFYDCKQKFRDERYWLELTTLVMLNRGSEREYKMLFFDGNQNAIAKSYIHLSDNDLDEMNVCATLDQAAREGIIDEVPATGFISLKLNKWYYSDNSLVSAWIKDITGYFRKTEFEVAQSTSAASGIGKTQCVTDYERYEHFCVPCIEPILIDGTGDGEEPCCDPE